MSKYTLKFTHLNLNAHLNIQIYIQIQLFNLNIHSTLKTRTSKKLTYINTLFRRLKYRI